MDKKFFRRFLQRLKLVNIWVLLAITVVSSLVFIFAMRSNNLTALQLRDKVTEADKNNTNIESALQELRVYIYSHMNTNLSSGPNAIKPPIQLKYTYERLLQAQQDEAKTQNAQIYSEAQAVCEQQFPKGLSGSGRIPCVTEYIASKGITQAPIDSSLYKFDFVSPLWTPDLAGWSLVIASIAAAALVIRLVLERWSRAELRDL